MSTIDIWVMLTGAFVAGSCGLLGCFLILRKMAMIGDAISHAVLPGIVIAFLFSGTRDSLVMLLGASILGLITVFLIQFFKNSGVENDASIGVVFTSLFALGVLLVSMYASHIDLDLDCVLFGEIAFVPFHNIQLFGIELPKAVWVTGSVFILTLICIVVFYKQLKVCSFDPALAAAIGIPVAFIHYLLMGLVSVTTVASFESVGAILVVGLMVLPSATAYLLTDRLSRMLVYSVILGTFSSVIGYYVSFWLDASIAGCMITVAGAFFVLAFLFSPLHGIVTRSWIRRRESKKLTAVS